MLTSHQAIVLTTIKNNPNITASMLTRRMAPKGIMEDERSEIITELALKKLITQESPAIPGRPGKPAVRYATTKAADFALTEYINSLTHSTGA